MFSNIFVTQLVEDIKNKKATITINSSACMEIAYDIIIQKNNKDYIFSGITSEQIIMLKYLLNI